MCVTVSCLSMLRCSLVCRAVVSLYIWRGEGWREGGRGTKLGGRGEQESHPFNSQTTLLTQGPNVNLQGGSSFKLPRV